GDGALPSEPLDAWEAAWAEPDDARRMELLEIAVADDFIYVDPESDAEGRQATSDLVAGFLQQFPGGSIPLDGVLLEHNGHVTFGWRVLDGQGDEILAG